MTVPEPSTQQVDPAGQPPGPLHGVDLHAVLASFDEPWSPRTVATVNDYDVRVVHAKGEFTPHRHPETDEFFLVLSGELVLRGEGGEVTLRPGQMAVVPRGARHQPVSPEGATVLLFEPSATVNTGDTPGELTAARRVV
jgi:mannose-6-phosphate isomerase-like protein (cupin superfamily)